MAWRQGVGFFSNRTIAQHTRKPMDAGRNRVVKILTNIVWILLYKLTAKFAEKLFLKIPILISLGFFQVAPFTMLSPGCQLNDSAPECQGNARFQGYCIDLLSRLAKQIRIAFIVCIFIFSFQLVSTTKSSLATRRVRDRAMEIGMEWLEICSVERLIWLSHQSLSIR